MRVLFITPRFPGDLRRGDQLRAYQQLRALSARHAITLLTFDQPPPAALLRAELERCCERVVVVKLDRSRMLLRALRALPGRVPLQAALYATPELRVAMTRAIGDGQFDLVHVQLARLGALVPRIAPLPCVLDLVDALSLNMRRRGQHDRSLMRYFARLEAARLAIYERQLCAQATAACVSCGSDGSAIELSEGEFHLVGNGVDLDAFVFDPHPRQANQVILTGNLGYFPNVDAAAWFAGEVMPRVRSMVPAANAILVGARPARSLRRKLAPLMHTRLVGAVERVQPYLARASVAVAPMRAGSGQQIKILEAMAIGTPVVATSLAAAGIVGAVHGEHLLVADSEQDFAQAVERLLTDRDLAERLARNARALIEQRHSWQASATALERAWIDAAQTRNIVPTAAAVP